MMQSLFVIHPFQLSAGWKFSGPHIRCITHLKEKTLPLVMQGFWLVGLFAKKLLSSESLLSIF
jgi:hypothetical protein